jgi:adenylosuccinate synthase
MSRIARFAPGVASGLPVEEHPSLAPFARDTSGILEYALSSGRGILVEGTQGFGLSLLHGDSWPKATARDTTASGFLSESGLPPLAVRDVVLVIRAMPIRVAGDSGPLKGETSWDEIRTASGSAYDVSEYTSVTNRLRRVGRFDPIVVRRAIAANGPTIVALNHLDHVDALLRKSDAVTSRAAEFLREVEAGIGRAIDLVGTGPERLVQSVAATGAQA